MTENEITAEWIARCMEGVCSEGVIQTLKKTILMALDESELSGYLKAKIESEKILAN